MIFPKKELIPKFNLPPIKRTPDIISKVKRLVDMKNPASIQEKKNDKTNCRKLYEKYLARDKSEFAVTLDEALIYEYETNGQTRICYVLR